MNILKYLKNNVFRDGKKIPVKAYIMNPIHLKDEVNQRKRFDICSKVFAGLCIDEGTRHYYLTGKMDKLEQWEKDRLVEHYKSKK